MFPQFAYPGDSKTIAQLRITIGIIARLLEYPSEGMIANSEISENDLVAVPKGEIRQNIKKFLIGIRKEPISALCKRYVSLFDFSEKTSLNMTYHIFGEERDRTQKAQRGAALLLLKSLYSEAGFEPSSQDLSDFLPMTLEFVAIAPIDQGTKVAELIREPLMVLRTNLKEIGTEVGRLYGLLLDACNVSLSEFISESKLPRAANTPEHEQHD